MNAITRGTLVALIAAALFGVTTPLIQRFSAAAGPFATALLLYVGAALGAGLPRRRGEEPQLQRKHLGRVALVALFGAAIAPACLAFGLKHVGALTASLLLNLEAVFTVAFARIFYREHLGRRVIVAVLLMVAGGAVLAMRTQDGGTSSALGIAAIIGATFGWAADNTLTRPLADYDPRAVVFGKASIGVALSLGLALLARDAWPPLLAALALVGCGASGYGISLRLYLRAQRALGAARTSSVFAFAPFVGAALAFVIGDRHGVVLVLVASLLFAAAVYLHATEHHAHRHGHEPIEHDHAHRHDDAHHDHVHDVPVRGEHSHMHRHEAVEHAHPHGSDIHHRHRHG